MAELTFYRTTNIEAKSGPSDTQAAWLELTITEHSGTKTTITLFHEHNSHELCARLAQAINQVMNTTLAVL